MESEQAIVKAAWKSSRDLHPRCDSTELEHHAERVDGTVMRDLDPVRVSSVTWRVAGRSCFCFFDAVRLFAAERFSYVIATSPSSRRRGVSLPNDLPKLRIFDATNGKDHDALLAPRAAAHHEQLPTIAGDRDPDMIDCLVESLADSFGVSPAFMAVRLKKGGIVAPHVVTFEGRA